MSIVPEQSGAVQPALAGGQGGGSSSLYDVLELVLDRGLVIDVFVRVSLVGIELLKIDARVVVASVDTYLRFAEACNRLDLESGAQRPSALPELVQDMRGSETSSETTGEAGRALTEAESRRGALPGTAESGGGARTREAAQSGTLAGAAESIAESFREGRTAAVRSRQRDEDRPAGQRAAADRRPRRAVGTDAPDAGVPDAEAGDAAIRDRGSEPRREKGREHRRPQ